MKYIEYGYFELKKDVNEEEFLKSAIKFNEEYFTKQQGFISNKLIKNEKGWVDLSIWDSIEDAIEAGKKMKFDEVAAKYITFIDRETLDFKYFSIEQEYLANEQ